MAVNRGEIEMDYFILSLGLMLFFIKSAFLSVN